MGFGVIVGFSVRGRVGGKFFEYSGDGKMLTSSDPVWGDWTYAYDAAGERVGAMNAAKGVTRTWLRDEQGHVLVTYVNGSPVKESVFGGSRLIGEVADGSVTYALTDHLGSTRMMVDPYGNFDESEIEFSPFGTMIGPNSNPSTTHLFTGHERDLGEMSGLDYMHARYYSLDLGRFLSVDPVGGTVGSSQSWNRYSYVLNNPVKFTDPTGMFVPGDAIVKAHKDDDDNVRDVAVVVSDSTPDNDFDDDSTIIVAYGGTVEHATEVTLNSEDDPYNKLNIVGKVPPNDEMTADDVRENLDEWQTNMGDPAWGDTESGDNQCYDLATHLTDRGPIRNFDVKELFRKSQNKPKYYTPQSGLNWWVRRMVPLSGK